jgi:thiamine biosynthesis lipoprotein
MITARPPIGRRWTAIGTWCEVLVQAPTRAPEALDRLADDAATYAKGVVSDLDVACSRFRPDSELIRLRHGTTVEVSATLDGAIAAALRSARATGGLVDPTIATALVANGYDDDLDVVRARTTGSGAVRHRTRPPRPAPGYWRIQHDPAHREVMVPHRVDLDLGASAKAWAADRIAAHLGAELPTGAGVLVNLGGDLAVAGVAPEGGWRISVDDGAPAGDRPVVTIRSGGLATSSTALRTWARDGEQHHHIIDPRTGCSAPIVWTTVTVAARTCELANAAATAAVILGRDAPGWLAGHGVDARLRAADGGLSLVGGWPSESDSLADVKQ